MCWYVRFSYAACFWNRIEVGQDWISFWQGIGNACIAVKVLFFYCRKERIVMAKQEGILFGYRIKFHGCILELLGEAGRNSAVIIKL